MKLNRVFLGSLCLPLMFATVITSAIATPSDGVVIGVTKIIDSGPSTDRYNLVLIAEGYPNTELDQFAADVQDFIDFFFSTPPFSTNCSTFNIWRIDISSNDSGADDPTPCGGTGVQVDTYFDAHFCGDGVTRRLLLVNFTTAINVLNAEVPEWDQALVIVNTDTYGGAGGVIGITSLSGSWQNIAIHEFGHAAFGLTDEYEYWTGCGIDTDRDHHPPVEPVAPNVTIETDRTLVKWSDLILSSTPVPTTTNVDCTQCDIQPDPYPGQVVVGLYESANYYHCDVFRPVFSCMMRYLSAPFCPVCTRRILQVLEPFQPLNSGPICDANGPYTVQCTGAITEVVLDGSGSSDTDCDPLNFTWSGPFDAGTTVGITPSVEFSDLGIFTVNLEISDGIDVTTCSGEVTILDTTPPLINCPTDSTVECGHPTDPDSTGFATATDCHPSPEITHVDVVTSDTCDVEYTITRTWMATDSFENSSSCDQIIDVCRLHLDDDCDGILSQLDNCPFTPNGPLQGTCLSGLVGGNCVNDDGCGLNSFCSMNQEDNYPPPGGNDIGDACECEGNFDCDEDVDGTDATMFKEDFGRQQYVNPCESSNPCTGNFDCDGDVDGGDAFTFKTDFGRHQYNNPCSNCLTEPWCE